MSQEPSTAKSQWQLRIAIDPAKVSEPSLAGRTLRVSQVLEELAGGLSVEQVLRTHPELERTDIEACLRYAAASCAATLPPLDVPAASAQTVDHSETPVAVAVPAPEAVPGYEVLDELGRGGMGVVYRARQIGLNREVALKMILAGALASKAAVRRFHTEAEAIARLQHPGIVQIYEIGDHRGQPYFSMEFAGGGSLDRYLADKQLTPEQAAALVASLADAIQAAHQRNIIHRDLKPANVLMTAEGQPKITDFGLAKQLQEQMSHTHTGDIVGTPSYMSPEQAAGKKELGPATDIYSLGAILYRLLAGRPPFSAQTVMDTLLQVLELEPAPVRQLAPQVPVDLETICLKCLQKDPARRYATAAALAADLRAFLAGEPIQARPPTVFERANRWLSRWQWTVLAYIAAGLALAALFVWLPINPRRLYFLERSTAIVFYASALPLVLLTAALVAMAPLPWPRRSESSPLARPPWWPWLVLAVGILAGVGASFLVGGNHRGAACGLLYGVATGVLARFLGWALRKPASIAYLGAVFGAFVGLGLAEVYFPELTRLTEVGRTGRWKPQEIGLYLWLCISYGCALAAAMITPRPRPPRTLLTTHSSAPPAAA